MNRDRWITLSPHEQLGAIGAEIMRAGVWQGKDREKFCGALARALDLVGVTFTDPKWRGKYRMLLALRDELAAFYCGKEGDVRQLFFAL